MRVERFEDDDLDIGWMVRSASSTWIGPNPRASQSRWGADAGPGRQVGRAVKLSAAAVAFTAVIFGSLLFAAVTVTPGDTVTPVTKLTNGMSHVFAGAVASPSQAPAIPASVLSPSSAAPRAGTTPVTGPSSRSTHVPTPPLSPSPRPTPHPTDE
jgi:hypothetical protein